MSQAGANTSEIHPTIATTYHTDSGDATPAANILNVYGDSNSDNLQEGIMTTGSGNTVTVMLTNRVEGMNTTVGAVTVSVNSLPLPATPGGYQVFARIAGYESTGPAYASITIEGCVGTDGAAASVVGVPTINYAASASLGAIVGAISVTGNSFNIDVTGVAGLTIVWEALTIFTLAE